MIDIKSSEEISHILLLNKGYIRTVETWGSDQRVIEAARMSTGKGFLGWDNHPCICTLSIHPGEAYSQGSGKTQCPKCKGTMELPGDRKLLRTLFTNGHTTPFEMCGATFEVYAPIFVFREWMRHRTLSYNEFSARYSVLPNDYYIPDMKRLMASKQSTVNNQGSQAGFDEAQAERLAKVLETAYGVARANYDEMIKIGISREIARLVIPVAQYSRMRVSGNLLNWIRFLRLRMPTTAQFEIREYAHVINDELREKFPETMKLYQEEYNARYPTEV